MRLEDRCPEPTHIAYLTQEAEESEPRKLSRALGRPSFGAIPARLLSCRPGEWVSSTSRHFRQCCFVICIQYTYIATSCKSSRCFLRAASSSVRQAIAHKPALELPGLSLTLTAVCDGRKQLRAGQCHAARQTIERELFL